ncbi:MAG: 2-oxoacid:acceptor oxidoreductase subunit alpha [Proteobacteria bacterium]|nr:2-oxoacid:acceptor oxidoreductase subunit alpha [Pseudomonadota bacterium]
MPSQSTARDLQGNQACALGAVAAGCRFYAGYPITPSSEIAETMSVEMPRAGGVFVQMEDEIASLGAVLGASMGGAKAMTATSGPGFSLKQEHIGYGAGAEIPCVIVNVMRGGPSTGLPTRPSQGDIMQSRWGTHGDHSVIVLAPASVPEIFSETIRAFALSERLRLPVIVLYDEVIGHLVETVEIPAPGTVEVADRKWATGAAESFQPYAVTDDLVPPMARPGDGYRTHTTGLTHLESGFPTQEPECVERITRRISGKLVHHRELIESYEAAGCEDAEIVVCAIGISARAARRAVNAARAQGIKAGLFRPITLWPFPESAFKSATASARTIIVAELNAGQLVLEIERLCGGARQVESIARVDGEPIEPAEIEAKIRELSSHG